MKQATTKLRSRAGESISEVLVALMIISMGLTMLAGLILTAGNLIRRSEDSLEGYVNAENRMLAHEQKAGSGQVKVWDQYGGKLPLTDGSSDNAITIDYYAFSAPGGEQVTSYSIGGAE